jgi:cytochrome c oxidase cbb3-type subunit III
MTKCGGGASAPRSVTICVAAAIALMPLAACEREERPFQTLPTTATRTQPVTESGLHPGGVPPPRTGQESPFRGNAWGISEGKRLYSTYNCVGCHANGGGGMGPPLMDDKWIYGSEGANIYQTIVEGRPNGMPSFRNKIPDQQVWMLVAYIQSMSGNAPMDVLPSRSDHMRYSTSENARRAEVPKQTGPH